MATAWPPLAIRTHARYPLRRAKLLRSGGGTFWCRAWRVYLVRTLTAWSLSRVPLGAVMVTSEHLNLLAPSQVNFRGDQSGATPGPFRISLFFGSLFL